MAAVSCAPLPKPIATTPPAKALRVSEFTWGNGIITKKFTFPAGIYRPLEEDGKGYFYFPEGQVQVMDTGIHYATKGGIYWKNNDSTPQHFFVRAPFGKRYGIISDKNIRVKPIR